MFSFTRQERLALSFFIGVVLAGSVFQYTFTKYPYLADIVNLIDSNKIYSKVDINTASHADLVNIPYIGTYTAANIIRYRQERGPFLAVEEVKNVKGIRQKNYERFYKYLKI